MVALRAAMLLAGLLLAAGSAGAAGYGSQTQVVQFVDGPGAGPNCAGAGCAVAVAVLSPWVNVDEATGRIDACAVGQPPPSGPGEYGAGAGAAGFNDTAAAGAFVGAGACASADPSAGTGFAELRQDARQVAPGPGFGPLLQHGDAAASAGPGGAQAGANANALPEEPAAASGGYAGAATDDQPGAGAPDCVDAWVASPAGYEAQGQCV